MGFNTTVVVLNDALHQIRDDKEFGAKLYSAVLEIARGKTVDISAGGHCNAATVIEQHHADGLHAVLVGGNYGIDLGYVGGYSLNPEEDNGARNLLRQLASNLGFDISLKKRKPLPPRKMVEQ
jgi:hypothetical protein